MTFTNAGGKQKLWYRSGKVIYLDDNVRPLMILCRTSAESQDSQDSQETG